MSPPQDYYFPASTEEADIAYSMPNFQLTMELTLKEMRYLLYSVYEEFTESDPEEYPEEKALLERLMTTYEKGLESAKQKLGELA